MAGSSSFARRCSLLSLALLLLVVRPAASAIFWTDGSDGVDCTSDGTGCSSLSITESAVSADHYDTLQDASNHITTSLNGGDGTSKRGYKVNVTGTTTRYREVTFAAKTVASMHLSMHVNTIAADKDIWVVRESSNNGCTVELNSDRTITLRYDATTIETDTGYIVHALSCAAPYESLLCDGTEDCPGTACGSCQSTGQGCGRIRMELTQENDVTTSTTTCRLRAFGRTLLEGETALGGSITGFRWGVVAANSGNATLFFDDAAISDTARIGWGFIGTLHPNADDLSQQWTRDNCDGATVHYLCENDYTNSPHVYTGGTSDFVRTNTSGREDNWLFSDAPLLNVAATYEAVSLKIIGRAATAASGTREVESRIYVCASGGCSTGRTYSAFAETIESGAGNTTDHLQHSHVLATQPSGSAWTRDAINRLGAEVGSSATDATNRLNAVLVEYFVRYPDPAAQPNLRDHDVGANDSAITGVWAGHSNTGGSAGGICISLDPEFAGDECTQTSCCSWDPECDSPTNGCQNNNQCRTCSGRRGDFNGTAGVPCGSCDTSTDCENGGSCTGDGDGDGIEEGVCSTANSECPDDPSGCGNNVAGFCDANNNIPCSTSADCDGFGGACETTATCDLQCGTGGICSGAEGYAGLAADLLSLDNEVICSAGAEGLAELNDNRLDAILAGNAPFCIFEAGGGKCYCDGDDDCNGGTCGQNGLCTGGDGCTRFEECGECTDSSDCGGGACIEYLTCAVPVFGCVANVVKHRCACQGPEPDFVFIHNTAVANTITAPCEDCGEPGCMLLYQQSQSGFGDPTYCLPGDANCLVDASADLCTTDTEARDASRTGPNGSLTARCVGHVIGAPTEPCITLQSGQKRCTATITGCWTNDDCPANHTCVGGDTNDPIAKGWCEPADDAACTNVVQGSTTYRFAKSGSFCRLGCGRCSNDATRRCAINGHCTGGGTCQANASPHADCRSGSDTIGTCTSSAPFVCKGRALCPSDRNTCSSQDDCVVYSGTQKNFSVTAQPECVSGRCRYGAPLLRAPGVAERAQRNHYSGSTRHERAFLDEMRAMQAKANALAGSDGGPKIVWIVEPGSAGPGALAFNDWATTSRLATHALNDPTSFPYVMDGREAMRRNGNDLRYMLSGDGLGTDRCINDDAMNDRAPEKCVHYSGLTQQPEDRSGQWQLGLSFVDFVQSLNTCAQGECVTKLSSHGPPCGDDDDCNTGAGEFCAFRGLPKPKLYCRSANFVFTNDTCSTDDDCTGGRTCEPRPCTCVCTTNRECQAWFGDASTCQSGQCKNGATDSCATIFNGDTGFACNLTSKKCEKAGPIDACPASLDSCRPE